MPPTCAHLGPVHSRELPEHLSGLARRHSYSLVAHRDLHLVARHDRPTSSPAMIAGEYLSAFDIRFVSTWNSWSGSARTEREARLASRCRTRSPPVDASVTRTSSTTCRTSTGRSSELRPPDSMRDTESRSSIRRPSRLDESWMCSRASSNAWRPGPYARAAARRSPGSS